MKTSLLSLTGTSYFVYFPGSYQNLGAISKDSKAMSVTKAENSESPFLLGSYIALKKYEAKLLFNPGSMSISCLLGRINLNNICHTIMILAKLRYVDSFHGSVSSISELDYDIAEFMCTHVYSRGVLFSILCQSG